MFMLLKFKKELDKKEEIYLRIKVKPGASETSVMSVMDDDTIKINLKAKPIKGKANQELIKLLSDIDFEKLEQKSKNCKLAFEENSWTVQESKLIKLYENFK